MKKSSIFYTITFIFVLTLISISLAFWWLRGYDKQNYTRELNTRYSIIARITLFHMNNMITDLEYNRQMSEFQAPEVLESVRKDTIIKNAKVLEEINVDIGSAAILLYKKRHFLKITHGDKILLLEDKDYQIYRYQVISFIFVIVVVIVLASYISIYRKIKPLKKIKKQIVKFANGDLNIEKVAYGNDEISDLDEAFYNSVMQIRKLNESRKLFLRNIMHELKTPITKGRITVEMIDNNKYKYRLINVFERLERLINEFVIIENITSGTNIINRVDSPIKELFENAKKISMIEDEKIVISYSSNFIFNVDLNLFCVALKNMIDNAIKYSNDSMVQIYVTKDYIDFVSKGEQLDNDLSYYTEAFVRGKNSKESFGLGLYIVDNILKSHGLKFEYRYIDGTNIFRFSDLKNISVSV